MSLGAWLGICGTETVPTEWDSCEQSVRGFADQKILPKNYSWPGGTDVPDKGTLVLAAE